MNNKKSLSKKQLANDVLDNLPGLVFRTINDGEWTFEYASRGAGALLGYAPEELINAKTLRNMIPKEDQALNRKVLSKVTKKTPHYKAVYRIRTSSGHTKWVQEEGTGIFSGKGRLVALDAFLMDITDQKMMEEKLRKENTRLRSNIQDRHRLDKFIGKSLAMKELYDLIMRAADSPATIVVVGESGTGKELAARAIHNLSDRSEKPFVVVNCGAIPENLIESEFFGYRKGAFSGALSDRQGLLEAAKGGTLFLDEVGEIPLNLQIKLLRALDGDGFTRVGDTTVRHSDFRLIAATHRDLEDLVRSGSMREDFYYRINAVRLRIPPLRERKDDILMLADHFIGKYAKPGDQPRLSAQAQSMLRNYSWPGNVRELQNVVYRYLVLGKIELTGEVLSKDTVSTRTTEGAGSKESDLTAGIEQLEKKMILDTLKRHKWHIGKSAQHLGFSRRTMQRRMKKYNLKR